MATKTVKQSSGTVRRLIRRAFITTGKKKPQKLSAAQEKTVRQRLDDELRYLDQKAIKVGITSVQVLRLLGPPYGRMAENTWLYPGLARGSFYVLRFVNDKVARKYFGAIYDVEPGR